MEPTTRTQPPLAMRNFGLTDARVIQSALASITHHKHCARKTLEITNNLIAGYAMAKTIDWRPVGSLGHPRWPLSHVSTEATTVAASAIRASLGSAWYPPARSDMTATMCGMAAGDHPTATSLARP